MTKKLVLVSGNFNVLHPGHLRLFRFAKEHGERLIVAVNSDQLAGVDAHLPENLRLEGIKSNSLVDEAFIANEPIGSIITRLQPDVVVKGKEHEFGFNEELNALNQYGGLLVFSSGEAIFSSIDLIRKEFQSFDSKTIGLPDVYLDRHKIHKNDLSAIVHRFPKLRVAVIGDLIIDEYITCDPLGMSQEDPTIVVTPIDSKRFIGGAGIVAAHAAGLGAEVNFFSVTGNDEARNYASSNLDACNVVPHLLLDESRPTTLKQRFRSKGKSLLRVSYLHETAISQQLQDKLFDAVSNVINQIDLLVFSDFNYGCLPQSLVERISALAHEKSVFMAADSQSSSQLGDIGRFKGMNLITPTEREARISTRNREAGLVVLAEELRLIANAHNVLLKMGQEGLLIHASVTNMNDEWLTDRVHALNSSPKDVAGAGDSLLITSALALASGANIWEAACLGSLAAAIQVGRVGNTPLNAKELTEELL